MVHSKTLQTERTLQLESKTTRRTKHRDKFKNVRKEVEKGLRKANRNYTADLSTCEDTKKFWNYIRSCKKDNVDSLKIGQKTITDNLSEADALTEQFNTVSLKKSPLFQCFQKVSFLICLRGPKICRESHVSRDSLVITRDSRYILQLVRDCARQKKDLL